MASLDSLAILRTNQMTLEESFKALKSAFSNKTAEAESHAKELSALKAKNETLAAELATLSEKLEEAKVAVAQRDELAAKIEELTASLAKTEKLKSEAVSQIETVGKKAAQIVAAAGASPVEINPAVLGDAKSANKTGAELWDEYLKMPAGAEKQKFYNQNRSAIIAHLGYK